MTRPMALALVLVLAGGAWLQADKTTKATIQALKAEVKALRAREKADVKAIEDRFKALIAQVEMPEVKDEEIRAALRKEEKLALAAVKDKTERKRIKASFAALINALTGDIKGRKQVVKGLKKEKTALVKQVRAVFTAQINELEAEIKALESGSSSKSKG